VEKKTAPTNQEEYGATLFERLRSFIESERASRVVSSVSGFLCLAPSILAMTGINSLFSDKFKEIALPLLLVCAATALGFYFGKSKED